MRNILRNLAGIYHRIRQRLDIIDIHVGDRVLINENCCEPYIGVTGTVVDFSEHGVMFIKGKLHVDDLFIHVKFDKPLYSGLDNEYFAARELTILSVDSGGNNGAV